MNNNKISDFKVLLIYANTPMEPLMPLGITSIATALQLNGFTVKLFDTTFYRDGEERDSQAARAGNLQIKPVDYSAVGIKVIEQDAANAFKEMLSEFRPHLIGLSCVELTYLQGLKLLEAVRAYKIPVIIGGSFATFSPELALSNDLIDMVCIGEGEKTIVQLAKKMRLKEAIENIPNLWVKAKGSIQKNREVDISDVATLPILKFDVFDPKRIYRAMDGKLYRMLPVEFSRGCPYKCTYCSAPVYGTKFSPAGKWLRFKSVDQIMTEIDFYIGEYDVEYFYFVSETFLAMPKEFKRAFYKRYEKYRIPFWFNTRPETVTETDITCLESIGCHRISLGIDSGNEEFRNKVLKRGYSNETVLRAIEVILKSKIQLSVNNIIGLPDETREMIFDTIELNRKFKAHSHSVCVFQPFRGTELNAYCVAKGYLKPSNICSESFTEPVLEMPSLTKEEIKGLYHTFNLYIALDKSLWADIRRAERMDEEGSRIFSELSKVMRENNQMNPPHSQLQGTAS